MIIIRMPVEYSAGYDSPNPLLVNVYEKVMRRWMILPC